jgi:hypothetical protein
MRTLRYILLLGFFLLISNLTYSSSIFYPYILKLENGIKIKSVAYRTYDTPEPGKSWIYKNNRLLYSIDKRLSGYVITNETGEILVEIDFSLHDIMVEGYFPNENGDSVYIDRYKGEAIKIYKLGKLEKVFDFKDLHIDKSVLVNNYNQFYWGTKDDKIKVLAYIQNDTLRLTSIDTCEIIVPFQNFKLDKKSLTINRQKHFSSLNTKRNISIKKHGIPDKFLLPLLDTEETIESKLADFLGYLTAENERDSAKLQIYIHTLLIDRNGKCIQCYVTPTLRKTTSIDFGYEHDKELEMKIEYWLMSQKYQTKMVPRWSDKYGFSDFIYLKK